MKSQIHVLILSILLSGGSFVPAQPKLSIDLGIGFYEPTLSGFDENETVQFPKKAFLIATFYLTGVSIMNFSVMQGLDIIHLLLTRSAKIYYCLIQKLFFAVQSIIDYFQLRPFFAGSQR